MNRNKETRKQVLEENDNNVKESRAKFQNKAYKSKKVKSKENVNDDKQIFNCYNLYFS